MLISLSYGGRGGVEYHIPCCDIRFIPLDEQDISGIARYLHCDSKSSQDVFFFKNGKYMGHLDGLACRPSDQLT